MADRDLSGMVSSGMDVLQEVSLKRGAKFAEIIEGILRANVESGRWQRYLERNGAATEAGYVQRLVKFYDTHHEYLYLLQVKKSRIVWEPLLKELQRWAFAFLGRWELEYNQRQEQMKEISDSAIDKLLQSNFPYDTRFEPWAHVLLLNVGKQHMRRMNRNGWDLQDKLVALSALDERPLCVSDRREFEERIALRCDLNAAISKLTPKRQQFARQHYCEGRSIGEIAEMNGGNRSALYKLGFDTRNQLREIMDENK